ncbi:hypothetical protein D3C86_1798390 [compost metagenome]
MVLEAFALARFLIADPAQQAGFGQCLEPCGQHRGRALQALEEIVESPHPGKHIAQDKHRPLFPDQGKRGGDGAWRKGDLGGFGHGESSIAP